MINFQRTMDPHSLDLVRDGKVIGFLQWHKDRTHRIVLHNFMEYLSIDEMKQILAQYRVSVELKDFFELYEKTNADLKILNDRVQKSTMKFEEYNLAVRNLLGKFTRRCEGNKWNSDDIPEYIQLRNIYWAAQAN